MKKLMTILAALVLVAMISVLTSRKHTAPISKVEKTDLLYVGPANQAESVTQASKNAEHYFAKIRIAREEADKGKYDIAIQHLKEAESEATLSYDLGLVYLRLADIFKKTNNIKQEIKYRKLLADHTGNPDLKNESLARAEELQKIINSNHS